MPSPPLFGLVLAGGASTRMGRDKAALAYHGQSQLAWTFELVSEACAAAFVSVRPDQRDEPTRATFPQVVDFQPGIGPIAGISAALQQHPKAAWLVVACDLPFVTRAVLENLIERRDPSALATAYRSAHDGLPEPLCAIWEPTAREQVLAYIASGKQCPRKFLINSNVKLLELPDAKALDNINTGEEFRAASEAIGHGGLGARGSGQNRTPAQSAASNQEPSSLARAPSREPSPLARAQSPEPSPPARAPSPEPSSLPRAQSPEPSSTNKLRLRIQYYALFREQAGRSEETLETTAATPAELYRELQSRYPFQLAQSQLKVAVNTDFRDWNAPLAAGDTVVFIPPVAGG